MNRNSILLGNYNEERNKTIFLNQEVNDISDKISNYALNNIIDNEFDEEKLKKRNFFFSENKNKSFDTEDWTDILTFSKFLTLRNLFYEKIDARTSKYFIYFFALILLTLILYKISSIIKSIMKKIRFKEF